MNRGPYENESITWKTLGDNTQEAAWRVLERWMFPEHAKEMASAWSPASASQFPLLPKAVEYKASWTQNDTQSMHSTAQRAGAPRFQDKGDI